MHLGAPAVHRHHALVNGETPMDETHPCPRKACSLMQEADASTADYVDNTSSTKGWSYFSGLGQA